MLEEYRREYAEFNTAWMREYYLFLSGQKADLEIAAIYDRYSDLFSAESIASLKKLLDETSEHFETERASIRHLLMFATEQYLENSIKHLTEAISQYESRAVIRTPEDQLTFQDSAMALRTISKRESRQAIYKDRAQVISGSNNLRAERVAGLHNTARSLGYASYVAMYEMLRELKFSDLSRQSQALVEQTETVYMARLDEALRRDLGIRLEQADRSDIFYFLHLTGYDARFPARDLLRIYKNTMAGLGIHIEAQNNISIDSAPRPRKSPRAFCMPILVPEEIMLVIRPAGGQADYQALLHEGGHAQHYGWTSASLKPEFKYTGDYALTETFAFLFNHLIADSLWLNEFLGFGDTRDLIRSVMLARLVSARRYVAKFIYEIELHGNEDFAAAASVYSELQTDSTRFNTDDTEFLFDLDDSFYSANYVRAWAFEVLLREYMKVHFGNRWWASRRAGNFLREIWETGDRYTADQVATQIGIGPISFEPLINEFNLALG